MGVCMWLHVLVGCEREIVLLSCMGGREQIHFLEECMAGLAYMSLLEQLLWKRFLQCSCAPLLPLAHGVSRGLWVFHERLVYSLSWLQRGGLQLFLTFWLSDALNSLDSFLLLISLSLPPTALARITKGFKLVFSGCHMPGIEMKKGNDMLLFWQSVLFVCWLVGFLVS